MSDVGSIPHSDPLAFFLTWTTYGSWLPGDDRGWVDGRGHVHDAEPLRAASVRTRMAETPVSFDAGQRIAVEQAIDAHCRLRGWHLYAVHCRPQHVHVVVTAVDRGPEDVMTQLKAWCTRSLARPTRSPRRSRFRKRWWTEGGSKRRIFHEGDLAAVMTYVKDCQGIPTRDPQPSP